MNEFRKGPNLIVSLDLQGPIMIGTVGLPSVLEELSRIVQLEGRSKRFYKKINCESLERQIRERKFAADHTGFITIEFDGTSSESHLEALSLLQLLSC